MATADNATGNLPPGQCGNAFNPTGFASSPSIFERALSRKPGRFIRVGSITVAEQTLARISCSDLRSAGGRSVRIEHDLTGGSHGTPRHHERLRNVIGKISQHVMQCDAIPQLHRVMVPPRLAETEVVDGNDIRMRQTSEHPGLQKKRSRSASGTEALSITFMAM
ncbi:MAG: hypothetical protein ACJASX_002963 [Limisphaerales bacterium]|jgi:hypothetical protein